MIQVIIESVVRNVRVGRVSPIDHFRGNRRDQGSRVTRFKSGVERDDLSLYAEPSIEVSRFFHREEAGRQKQFHFSMSSPAHLQVARHALLVRRVENKVQ